MLSILIPTYQYNVFELVSNLHQQAQNNGIEFEICVYDDCSPIPVKENNIINTLAHARYTVLDKNIGRSAIRNKLAHDATFKTLLFLDADTKIIRDDFIQKYLDHIQPNTQIIYGGICYQKSPPPSDQILRWHYGNDREALTVKERNLHPHLRFLTLNFLIKKSVFETITFNENIPNLRHEDTLFALDAKKKNVHVGHIDNPVMHLGLENSEVFLRKSMESVDALHQFVTNGLIEAHETSLSKKAISLKKNRIAAIVQAGISLGNSYMKKNLLSKKPSLFLFDIYRLGYYLKQSKNKA
ncbi:MAG: glycosyltransferase involved in cell wall biosynthesis [Flavobacteriales bacterium]|jgi:glycosyltransferase involved in cell wall biosynthesis